MPPTLRRERDLPTDALRCRMDKFYATVPDYGDFTVRMRATKRAE